MPLRVAAGWNRTFGVVSKRWPAHRQVARSPGPVYCSYMIRNLLLAMACAALCCPQAAAGVGDEDPSGWLEKLESPEFAVRERAGGKLAEWAKERTEEARALFLGQFLTHEDPEVRMRCRDLLRASVVAEFRGRGKGFVGIMMMEMPVEGGGFGVRISMVQPDTPAAKAGLKVGDVIEALDGRRWDAPQASEQFKAEVMSRRPGDKVVLRIRRQGEAQPLDVEVELGERPPDQELIWPQLRIDPEIRRRQMEEIKRREEEAFFQRWLDQQLERHQKGASGAARR